VDIPAGARSFVWAIRFGTRTGGRVGKRKPLARLGSTPFNRVSKGVAGVEECHRAVVVPKAHRAELVGVEGETRTGPEDEWCKNDLAASGAQRPGIEIDRMGCAVDEHHPFARGRVGRLVNGVGIGAWQRGRNGHGHAT
jgi:hypothetical protein